MDGLPTEGPDKIRKDRRNSGSLADREMGYEVQLKTQLQKSCGSDKVKWIDKEARRFVARDKERELIISKPYTVEAKESCRFTRDVR